jgi:hypothetical protein
MDIKAELGRVRENIARLKFELFNVDNRRASLVQELLKLQGQMELLSSLDRAEFPMYRDSAVESQPKGDTLSQSKGEKEDAGTNTEVKPPQAG